MSKKKTSTDDEKTLTDFEKCTSDVKKAASDVEKLSTDVEKTVIVTDDEKTPNVVEKATNDDENTATDDEKTTTGVETTDVDSKTGVTEIGPATPTTSAGNEPDPTAPINNCPHHFPVEPATCTCSNVSLCCCICISETIRDLQSHFDGKIKAVCVDFHSKPEDVQRENVRLLDLVKKYTRA